MQSVFAKKNQMLAASHFTHQTIPKERGGDPMLKMNIFAFTVTINMRQPIPIYKRYEDEQRIKELTDRMLDKRAEYARYYW